MRAQTPPTQCVIFKAARTLRVLCCCIKKKVFSFSDALYMLKKPIAPPWPAVSFENVSKYW